MNKPKLAIITPTFHENRLHYLQEALFSIFKQSEKDFVIIVCDDNPGRNNKEELIDITKFDDRVKYISNKVNLWIAWSRNVSIQKVLLEYPSVSYISFVDDDDWWISEDKIHEQIKYMKNNSSLWVIWTNWFIVDELSNYISRIQLPEHDHCIRNKINFSFPFLPSSMVFRKDIFNTLQLNETLLWSDDYLLIYQILKLYKGYTIQESMSWYRVHWWNTSYNIDNIKKLTNEKITLIREYWWEFPYHNLWILTNIILQWLWPTAKKRLKKIRFSTVNHRII